MQDSPTRKQSSMKNYKIIYVTLNNKEEARRIGRKILDARLANCVNWFPITCMYNWQGEITEEPEVVLLIKTLPGKFNKIEKIIKSEIDYTNCIAELNVDQNSDEFCQWLKDIIK